MKDTYINRVQNWERWIKIYDETERMRHQCNLSSLFHKEYLLFEYLRYDNWICMRDVLTTFFITPLIRLLFSFDSLADDTCHFLSVSFLFYLSLCISLFISLCLFLSLFFLSLRSSLYPISSSFFSCFFFQVKMVLSAF